jgi:hypothetical protein
MRRSPRPVRSLRPGRLVSLWSRARPLGLSLCSRARPLGLSLDSRLVSLCSRARPLGLSPVSRCSVRRLGLSLGSGLVSLSSRAPRLGLSLEPHQVPHLGHSMALRPVPVLPRLRVWQPQPPLRSVARSRLADSLAHPRDLSARTSTPAVHLPSIAELLLRQLPPRLAPKPVCPPHRPLLPRGRQGRRCSPDERQGRRCSPRLRCQSPHRARIRTL